MSWKTIAVLLVLALGLGAYFYYDTYWLVPAREKAESVKGRLWTIEPKDVEAVSIKRAGDTIRLKRVEGGWEMLEPVAARVFAPALQWLSGFARRITPAGYTDNVEPTARNRSHISLSAMARSMTSGTSA